MNKYIKIPNFFYQMKLMIFTAEKISIYCKGKFLLKMFYILFAGKPKDNFLCNNANICVSVDILFVNTDI